MNDNDLITRREVELVLLGKGQKTERYKWGEEWELNFSEIREALSEYQPEIVRCKDCKHRPKGPNLKTYKSGFYLEFPEDSKCPCQCSGDQYYSWYPEDDWFCANGERQ